MSQVFIVKYAPVGLCDRPTLQSSYVYLPGDGYGAGYNHPPELNKIYDPKRPRYPGWWVHMFISSIESRTEAMATLQQYLLTNYKIKVERKSLK